MASNPAAAATFPYPDAPAQQISPEQPSSGALSSGAPNTVAAPNDAAQSHLAAPPGFNAPGSDASGSLAHSEGHGALSPETDETMPGHRPGPAAAAETHTISEVTGEPPSQASEEANVSRPPAEEPAPPESEAGSSGLPEAPQDQFQESARSAGEQDAQIHSSSSTESQRLQEPGSGSGGESVVADDGDASGDADVQMTLDFDRTWQRIEDAYNEKQTLTALVVDRVKGGLVVDIGVQGFVPASQITAGKVNDLDRFIGRTLSLRITDLDRERQRVVLSARMVQEEEHARRKRETMERLATGLVTEGIVRRLTDFGAFIDIGGVDGLLHVSEMSWSRVKHPNEIVKPGDRVKVKVLKVSDDKKKISLGMRQLLPDPWSGIDKQFKVGEVVEGKVVRVVPTVAFVQVRDGVDAVLPNSEISVRKPRAEDLPQVGDTVRAKIIELRPEARRMTLSVRRIQEDDDRREYQQHVKSRQGGGTTIGDIFGDVLSEWNEENERNREDR